MNNKLYLVNNDFKRWNNELELMSIPCIVKPKYTNNNYTSVDIEYYKIENIISPLDFKNINVNNKSEFNINYNFNVSINLKSNDLFIKILNDFEKAEFVTIFNISSDNIKININTENHKIAGIDYIRYEYNLTGHISNIMKYVKIYESAIEVFEKISLCKFKKNSIVSIKSKRDINFVIKDYNYIQVDSGHKIRYVLIEIDKSELVIKYKKEIIVDEDVICFSREDRINSIGI